MRLLITGGSGFIGSHLLERALRETGVERVVNLDRLTYAAWAPLPGASADPRHAFVHADLRDADAVHRTVRDHDITHVAHLAAETHVDRSIAGPDLFLDSNVRGTLHLLEACRSHWKGKAGERLFLQVSTDEVFGPLLQGAATVESPYRPANPYAASKASADHFARSYENTYGLPVKVAYCCNNYGPRQHPEKLIPLAITQLWQRKSVPLYGDGSQRRDWIHAADHVEALWLLLSGRAAGRAYAIAAGEERPNRDLVRRIAELVDELAPELGGNSPALIRSVKDRPGHDWRYALDSTPLRKETGWSPTRSLEEGLRDTVSWYLDRARSHPAQASPPASTV